MLDTGLPEMDKYELARRLRRLSETQRCHLIAITGHGQEQDREPAFDAGFDDHFTKSISVEALFASLQVSSAQ